MSYLTHCFGDQIADGCIAVGRDGPDLGNRFIILNLFGQTLNLFNRFLDCFVDAAFQCHWARSSGNGLDAFTEDCLSQNGSGGRSVACDVRGLGSDFAHHLGAGVLEFVFQFDLLGNGDTVLCYCRRSELLLNHDVAALGAERHFHCVRQTVHACQKGAAGLFAVCYVFSHLFFSSF